MEILSSRIIKIMSYLFIHCTEILFSSLIDTMLFCQCLCLSVCYMLYLYSYSCQPLRPTSSIHFSWNLDNEYFSSISTRILYLTVLSFLFIPLQIFEVFLCQSLDSLVSVSFTLNVGQKYALYIGIYKTFLKQTAMIIP